MNKPVNPREPLKRTANNNWIHVTCAVFTPEIKFGNGKALEPSEGIGSIPTARWQETCKVCKKQEGACVSCHTCRVPGNVLILSINSRSNVIHLVHVECAHQAGYILGFDMTPVKGSRREQFNIVTIAGEVGTMTAAIWCKEHVPSKTIVHQMHDIVDEDTGLNALQLYVQNFKQADLALTGTVRKATLVSQSTKIVNPTSVAPPPNRRASATTNNASSSAGRGSMSHSKSDDGDTSATGQSESRRTCVTCDVDISPMWWPFPPAPHSELVVASLEPSNLDVDQPQTNGHPLTNGHGTTDSGEESNGDHVALAAAALHQDPPEPASIPTEFQCHQCHRKKKRKELSPPPPLAPCEVSRPPIPAPQPTTAVISREADSVEAPQHPSAYNWPPAPPPPPSYATNGPPNGHPYRWSRPSPTSQNIPLVNQLNGNHSPRINHGSVQNLGGQPPMRHTNHGLPHSPRQNGHHQQVPNGYPPSPRHTVGSPALHMQNLQNGSYPSYASTRPSPQHLTNGGPPPRAPEHPFSQNNPPVHSRGSFGPPQGSPPIHRDAHLQGSVTNPQANSSRSNDGRVNGGASASPSLRNLLS